MEYSRNQEQEPMGKSKRVQGILRALSDRFTGEPFPSMSEHFKRPMELGGVVAVPSYMQIEIDYLNGYGEVADNLRTMAARDQLGLNVDQMSLIRDDSLNRWDDMGRY